MNQTKWIAQLLRNPDSVSVNSACKIYLMNCDSAKTAANKRQLSNEKLIYCSKGSCACPAACMDRSSRFHYSINFSHQSAKIVHTANSNFSCNPNNSISVLNFKALFNTLRFGRDGQLATALVSCFCARAIRWELQLRIVWSAQNHSVFSEHTALPPSTVFESNSIRPNYDTLSLITGAKVPE